MISDMIRRMREAGAPLEAIMIAVETVEAYQRADADRRERRAAQKRKERGGDCRATVARQGSDKVATVAATGSKTEPVFLGKNLASPPSPPKGGSVPPQGPRPKRAFRLPADWQVSQTDRDYAVDHGLPIALVAAEGEKFRDYWHAKAGAGATKHDWAATWRTWVRTAVDRLPLKPPARAGPPRATDGITSALRRIDEARNGPQPHHQTDSRTPGDSDARASSAHEPSAERGRDRWLGPQLDLVAAGAVRR